MSIYFFYGQEDYLIDKEIKEIKSKFLKPEFISMNYRILDNPSAPELLECCENSPMMFGDIVNLIHINKYVIGNKMSLTDEQLSLFDEALKKVQNNVHLVFVCKIQTEDNKITKPDARKKFFKILTKYANTKEFPRAKAWDKKLIPIITDMAKGQELKISPSVCSSVIEQIGTGLTTINTEISKLKLAIYPRTTIEEKDIREFCSSDYDVFELLDVIISGNKDELIKKYTVLTEKKNQLEILAIIQGSLSRYLFIKVHTGKVSAAEIGARLNNMNEFVVKKTQEKLSKISLDKLLKIKHNLLETEYKLKAGKALLPDILLEITLLE